MGRAKGGNRPHPDHRRALAVGVMSALVGLAVWTYHAHGGGLSSDHNAKHADTGQLLTSGETRVLGAYVSELPQVPRVRWNASDATSLAQFLLTLRAPVILSGTVVDQWRARTRWSPQYLTSRIATLDRVYESRGTRVFGPYYDEGRPMARLPSVTTRNSYREISMETSAFFAREQHGPELFYYYSGELERLGAELLDDVQVLPWLSFRVAEGGGAGRKGGAD